ncbi:MAG: hypothetical protein U5J64_06105 [Halobacteriales archaeon]|nr:hypothetical protein [Halobacteriales archaeon]
MSKELIRKSLDESTKERFESRVESQAEFLRKEITEGRLDNSDYTIGLEIEVYCADSEGRLARFPSGLYDACGERLNKELGLHNAEINTSPDVLSEDGLESQESQVLETLAEAAEVLDEDGEGKRVVLDSMWTIPPEEGSMAYLDTVEERDGVVSAKNMRADERYEAIDNYYLKRVCEPVGVSVPGADLSFSSILVESLATSIQPHHQIPRAEDLPRYYNTASRTMAPVLALTTNSPFLPPDLYGSPDESLLDETYHELRIPVFEQSVNPPGGYNEKKVRFPRDLNRTEDMLDKVTEDRTYSPFLREWNTDDEGDEEPSEYTDNFWEFEYKRGTYWRWLRAVVGGESVSEGNDERSIRLEYRPLPTQPSVRDTVGLQALVSGMLAGMSVDNHPLPSLDWEKARESFYAVVEDGIDADIAWVDEDGDVTYDKQVIYDEIFRYARLGLEGHGVGEETYERYVEPLRVRWEERTTPSVWKIERVRENLDEGASFEEAVHGMQRKYIRMSDEHDTFADWI